MRNKKLLLPTICIIYLLFNGCNKDVKEFTYLNFIFEYDNAQERLNNFGETAIITEGNATQSPIMNQMSIHYLELSYDEFTAYKSGEVIYKAPETTLGGQLSIAFDSAIIAASGDKFISFNILKLQPGTYNYVRASISYQNFSIKFNLLNIPGIGDLINQNGTIASFIGYRTYISNLKIKNLSAPINADKLQGFWGFETEFVSPYNIYNAIYTGQAPEGSTTVVNPIFLTSPVPDGSCVITGKFSEPLIVTGTEDENKIDLNITMTFSINESFEWIDTNGNEAWDIDASNPANTEQIVDMGLRGLIPNWEFTNE